MVEYIKTLKKVTLPSTLKEIGSDDIHRIIKTLHTINLPDGLTRIGSYAIARDVPPLPDLLLFRQV